METDEERQRKGFVADHESGQWSMTELCERYGISRPTGYELLRRVEAEGQAGLRDRSRTPHTCPHRTPAEVEGLILGLRSKYGWGAKKLLQALERQHPRLELPARSTVNVILDRHGKLHYSEGLESAKKPEPPVNSPSHSVAR